MVRSMRSSCWRTATSTTIRRVCCATQAYEIGADQRDPPHAIGRELFAESAY